MCVARGIPSDLYWRLTPPEVTALLEELVKLESEREKRAIKRAGLIAAAIYNNNPYRRPGSRAKKADDFLADRRRGPELGSPQWAEAMRDFARRHNQQVQ